MKRNSSTRSGRAQAGSRSRALSIAPRTGESQPFGVLVPRSIALPARTCASSVANLNRVLADTMFLRDLYKKHHWQTTGPTFQQLHELFDAHYGQQADLVDVLAERIAMLGGVGVAMPHDVAELASIPRPPRGREPVAAQLARLLEAHETIIGESRTFAAQASDQGDDGTNDMLVGQVIRTNEMQAWFLAENAGR
ncbi:MAG: DNA starvation/stationary phase protection protein [Phycisphaerales bacterium]